LSAYGNGLDKLVECLERKIEKFPLSVKYFTEKGYSIDKIKLLFRKDPSHYVSASGMFNDSLYKSSRVELKLMTDMDEYLIVENGI
ncbi:35350_t:CDS:2, partial [Racocetra persica]